MIGGDFGVVGGRVLGGCVEGVVPGGVVWTAVVPPPPSALFGVSANPFDSTTAPMTTAPAMTSALSVEVANEM